MVAAVTSNNQHLQLRSAIKAFQKQYQLTQQDGVIDNDTMLAINSIVKQKEFYEPQLREIEPQRLETMNRQLPIIADILTKSQEQTL